MKRMLGHWTAQWAIKRLSPTERGTSTGEQSIRPLSTMGWQEGHDSHALKEYDKASKYQDAEDAKAQLAKAAAKAQKAADAKPEDAKLADAAAKAKKAADDAADPCRRCRWSSRCRRGRSERRR